MSQFGHYDEMKDIENLWFRHQAKFLSVCRLGWGSVAQWLARRTRDSAVAGPIPTTAHVAIALGKQFTSSVYPCEKWVPGYRQLKCIHY